MSDITELNKRLCDMSLLLGNCVGLMQLYFLDLLDLEPGYDQQKYNDFMINFKKIIYPDIE